MNWQGIPFKFLETDVIQRTFIDLSYVPEIMLNTGFSWDSLISGLVAGSIPAIVAIIAMRSNSKNIQEERRHQLELANSNISLQITYASRQVWINDLREAASTYLGKFTAAVNAINLQAYEVSNGTGDSDANQKYFSDQVNAMNELGLLTAKITLMLNPEEEASKRVTDSLNQLKVLLTSDRLDTTQIRFNDIEELTNEFRTSIYVVIKNEWKKLKGKAH
ncbi:hypothetical protein ACV8VY_18575 [Citrobacter freundii]|uniref:hypothetical protein n=1 Tax=Citrobacter TaxID=544 RepID=UPI002576B27E|nr:MULTISPECIES: hypothetical protein [Citrobacter]MDM3088931.1 hypothetical protein [Citrobacter sp. Cf133]MDT7441939.1 hypothetical protein [Citrobacter freundii]MDT9380757.1 hypothetical protein [Citrobacter freundii]HDX5106959.1 hypothetical protein [Citrobacter freundii]